MATVRKRKWSHKGEIKRPGSSGTRIRPANVDLRLLNSKKTLTAFVLR